MLDFVQDIGYNQAKLAADELSSDSDSDDDKQDTSDELDLGELKLERRSSYILQQQNRDTENFSLEFLDASNYASVISGEAKLSIGCLVR